MPSKTGVSQEENRFLESITGVKIEEAATVALDQLFMRCMLKVGIRSQNLPSQEETLILHDHIRKNYGRHTIPEIDLAFELAISGQLNLDQSEVTCYENFSCLYLSGIINAYRQWATNTHKQIKNDEPVEAKTFSIDWREITQQLLDSFFTGTYKPRLVPAEVYDTLVFDQYLNPLAYECFLENASLKLRNDIQKEIIAVNSKIQSLSESSKEHSMLYVQQQNLDKKIIEYRNGSRDAEVKLLAKQMCVYHYFSYLKVNEISKIYQPT